MLLFLLWLAYEESCPDFESCVFLIIALLTLWGYLQKRRILPLGLRRRLHERFAPSCIRLRALHIRLIRGKETPASTPDACTCLNCGEVYHGNFCPRCGQSRDTRRYRLANALRNIAGGFFNIDSGFGRTLLDLLHRPGYMMADFIAGRRAPQFRPFQMLFILAALYIMVVQLVDPEALRRREQQEKMSQTERLELTRRMIQSELKEEPDSLARNIMQTALAEIELRQQADSLKAAGEEEVYVESQYDSSFTKGLRKANNAIDAAVNKALIDSPYLSRVWELLKSWGHGNKAFRIIATLPLFALASFCVFCRRRFRPHHNLTEQLFIQAYIACQTLLFSILVLPFCGHARVDDLYEVPLGFIFLLFWIDFKQLYRLPWWGALWGTVRMFVYTLLILIALAALIVAGILLLV